MESVLALLQWDILNVIAEIYDLALQRVNAACVNVCVNAVLLFFGEGKIHFSLSLYFKP